MTDKAKPSLSLSLVPLFFLLISMSWFLLVAEQEAHIALILTTVVAVVVGLSAGNSWEELESGLIKGLQLGLSAIIILMVIGLLIAVWIAAGIVPLFITLGLDLLSAAIFLPAVALICGLVSLATGSSWTTAGTVGVAFIGVGAGLGVPLPMVAGAIVSGAYFGDKISPLSDSTNLAAAVTGVDLFTHIRHMTYTTFPAFGLALVGFFFLGLSASGGEAALVSVEQIQTAITGAYDLSLILLLAPASVIVMSLKKIPALPALVIATLIGGVLAIWIQGVDPAALIGIAYGGYEGSTGVAEVDRLLSRGGLEPMMYTISLILCALMFGGVMEATGFINRIAEAILSRVQRRGGLVTATIASCIGMNLAASDQYLAIIVPGRMFAKDYRRFKLAPKNLSRTIEDGGTMTSALIPWNTCGATMMASLAVHPFAFLPYAFFNLLTPLIAILWAYLGIGQAELEEEKSEE
jgi:NhaC family Na+:H+ antiporter|tara:strand:+ start:1341 stop:2735 length:1395 start_codon:yes stop_codon:yes gene_type:complete